MKPGIDPASGNFNWGEGGISNPKEKIKDQTLGIPTSLFSPKLFPDK